MCVGGCVWVCVSLGVYMCVYMYVRCSERVVVSMGQILMQLAYLLSTEL